jgi:hypothetical protein
MQLEKGQFPYTDVAKLPDWYLRRLVGDSAEGCPWAGLSTEQQQAVRDELKTRHPEEYQDTKTESAPELEPPTAPPITEPPVVTEPSVAVSPAEPPVVVPVPVPVPDPVTPVPGPVPDPVPDPAPPVAPTE